MKSTYNISPKLSQLHKLGIRVWNWPSPGAQPTKKREITVLRIHIKVKDFDEVVSPDEYHGPVAVAKATARIVDYLHKKYVNR